MHRVVDVALIYIHKHDPETSHPDADKEMRRQHNKLNVLQSGPKQATAVTSHRDNTNPNVLHARLLRDTLHAHSMQPLWFLNC